MLWCLHGNLGLPSDWDFMGGELRCGNSHALRTPNIWEVLSNLEHPSIQMWAAEFLKDEELRNDPFPILLGYSLGARLALSALLQAPNFFRAAILVSCHPGGLTREEQLERYAEDVSWAKEFSDPAVPFAELLLRWNNQSVFAGRGESFYTPPESNASAASNEDDISTELREWEVSREPFPENLREQVAAGFLAFSLAKVEYDPERINRSTTPILWMVGARDEKFVRLSDRIHSPSVRKQIVESAGHRVPWEAPGKFLENVRSFIKDCEAK